MAWTSNSRSAAHEQCSGSATQTVRRLRHAFLAALADIERKDPRALAGTEVLYVVGRR